MEKRNRKKGNRGLLVALIVILAAILVTLLYVFVLQPQGEQQAKEDAIVAEENAQMGILPDMSDEEIRERLNTIVADSMLNISINSNPVFATGGAEGNLRIENIPGNQYGFVVEIKLDDTGETIYKSGLIAPGYFVEKATLLRELKKGIYPATAVFTAYETDGKREVGSAGARINITVTG